MSTATTTDVAAALDGLFGAARRARSRAGVLPGGLSLAQCHLLEPLADGAPRPAGELALAAGVAKPTATRMLDALEREGIATRTRSVEDRRCVLIALTEDGRDRVAQATAARAAWRETVLSGLPAAERAETARVLHRLTALIEEHTP